MALIGLEVGLTWRDMRHMKYTHLLQMLYEWADMHEVGDDDDEPEPSNDAAGLLGL